MDACGCAPPPTDGPPSVDGSPASDGEGFASIFTHHRAEADLKDYRRKGPSRTTALLLDLLRPYRHSGTTLLDVGGGIGVVDQVFLAAGAERAVLVDGSPAFMAAARAEAERAGTTDRMEFLVGDFVRLAPDVAPADVVTLDRVVCCYPDAGALVSLSAARARHAYGLVLPRDRRLAPLLVGAVNVGARLRHETWRLFAHPNRQVDALVAEAGLTLRSEARTPLWRVAVYERTGEAAS